MKRRWGPTEWRPCVRGGPLMRCNPFCFAPFPSSALIVTLRSTVVPPKNKWQRKPMMWWAQPTFPSSPWLQSGVGSSSRGPAAELLIFVPELTYAWIFNEYPQFVQQDSRRFISQETGSLYIAKVERSDVGNYTCVVNNTVTGDKVLSSPTPLVLRSDGKCILSRFKQQRHMFQHHFLTFLVPERRWDNSRSSTPLFFYSSDCKPENLMKTHNGLQL